MVLLTQRKAQLRLIGQAVPVGPGGESLSAPLRRHRQAQPRRLHLGDGPEPPAKGAVLPQGGDSPLLHLPHPAVRQGGGQKPVGLAALKGVHP